MLKHTPLSVNQFFDHAHSRLKNRMDELVDTFITYFLEQISQGYIDMDNKRIVLYFKDVNDKENVDYKKIISNLPFLTKNCSRIKERLCKKFIGEDNFNVFFNDFYAFIFEKQ